MSSVAVLETLHRLVSALLSDAQVQQGDDEYDDRLLLCKKTLICHTIPTQNVRPWADRGAQ